MSIDFLQSRVQNIELTHDERKQLITIIDLLIPSDSDFPPPSSLRLIDVFLHHLQTNRASTLLLSKTRLRAMLREMNALSDGDFCNVSKERQQAVLRYVEQCNPALFQTIWTLVNHSYYSQLALLRGNRQRVALS